MPKIIQTQPESQPLKEDLFRKSSDRGSISAGFKFTQGDRVVIHGLVNNPELNGVQGDLLRYDGNRGRYVVHITTDQWDKNIRVQPVNLSQVPDQLSPGTKVFLYGLSEKNKAFNGRTGEVISYNEARSSYEINWGKSKTSFVGAKYCKGFAKWDYLCQDDKEDPFKYESGAPAKKAKIKCFLDELFAVTEQDRPLIVASSNNCLPDSIQNHSNVVRVNPNLKTRRTDELPLTVEGFAEGVQKNDFPGLELGSFTPVLWNVLTVINPYYEQGKDFIEKLCLLGDKVICLQDKMPAPDFAIAHLLNIKKETDCLVPMQFMIDGYVMHGLIVCPKDKLDYKALEKFYKRNNSCGHAQSLIGKNVRCLEEFINVPTKEKFKTLLSFREGVEFLVIVLEPFMKKFEDFWQPYPFSNVCSEYFDSAFQNCGFVKTKEEKRALSMQNHPWLYGITVSIYEKTDVTLTALAEAQRQERLAEMKLQVEPEPEATVKLD